LAIRLAEVQFRLALPADLAEIPERLRR